ncbi:MAG: 2-hydroxyacid dehydrogenase [Bacteroidota bacterium]
MRIAFFSAKPYDRRAFEVAESRHDITYFDARLAPATAPLAEGHEAVCAFVSDDLSAGTLDILAAAGIRLVLLRSAGFNHIDLEAAEGHGLVVARVPAYSPHAVAEHAIALALALNRRLHRAHNRVREGNFELAGLLGVDLHGKTAGIVGTGRIGAAAAKILGPGFGMRLLVHDPYPNPEVQAMGASYVDIDTLLVESDLVSLHCPLTPESYHLLNASAFARMKPSAILVNTSRGGLVDTAALVDALKEGQIGAVALDVYEEEGDLFFQDLSDEGVLDDVFARLLTFPNALITGHQGFFTAEALSAIAETTLSNATAFDRDGCLPEPNAVTAARHTA